MAAVAGSLFASHITFIDPSSFWLMESIFYFGHRHLGRTFQFERLAFGRVILILSPEALRFVGLPNDIAAQMRQVIYGIILIVLMSLSTAGAGGGV